MTEQHARGAVNKARGRIEQAIGWLTGHRGTEVRGKVREAQGSAQQGLGDIQDAVHKDGASTQ